MTSDSGCNVSIVEISAGTNKIVEIADATGKIVEVQTQGPKGPNFDPSLSPAYTNPANNDLLPIYDVANGVAKKITLEDLIAKRARDSRRIYLSKDARASDSNNGTSQEEPLLTFAAAIAAAEPGDVIEVSPGTYTETSLPLRVKRDVGIFAKSLRQVKIQPAAGQEMNGFFKVDSGFWVWGLEFAGHQADLANNQQSWAISFDDQADNTAAPLNASGLGAFILKSPYIQNCSSITAEDDAGNAGSVSVGDTGGGIEVDGDKCAANSPIRSMVVDSYTQVNLGGPGCHILNDGYAQLVSFFGTFCTFHVKTESGGQGNLSGGGTTDFGDQGLVADGYSRLPNFTGAARIASYGADRAEAAVTIDVNTDTFTTVNAHPLVANDQLAFNATDGTLPTGLAEATTYFVISSGLTSNNFKVSLTQGGASVDITGSASGAYQFTRQGELTAEVISLTSNRIGTLSRPNPGQLMFPRQTFPSAGQPGSAGNAVGVTAGTGNSFTVILNSFSYAHEYVSGGTVTISGTTYTISSASYSHATGVTTLSATGYTPNTGDSAVLSGLDFICPIQGAYIITGSVPIDVSGNVVAADSSSLAGYRLNFFNTVNGGLRTPISVGQQLDFRLRSQISCALHTMEFVGAGTNYDALPWNGGVPIPANQRVELNNGRVFGATINERGDFEIGDGTFSIDGTTGEATINTSQFNISGLNFIGPFSRNGGFSTVGVQLKEISANTSLIASTGAADGNTAPTQSAVKAYVDSTTVQSVDLSAPTGFTSTGGPITGSGTLGLGYDTGYQGYLTAESTKLAGIEAGATADQTDAEIKAAYENNADTNAFTNAEQSKLSGIETNATQDQTASEIKTAYESNGDTNAYTDAEQTKLTGIESGATADQTASEIKTAYESNSDTNAFTDAEQTKLSGVEAGAQVNVATNLSYANNTRILSSSTGADATLPLAVAAGDAGLLTGSDKTQLDNLSTNLAGKANLVGGKLAVSELPDLAITEFKGTVASQAAMLAITGEKGDWVVRSDEGKVYVITGTDPTQIGSWTALSYPASDVLSVNGLTGTVVLDADSISDTSTTNKYTTAAEISKLSGIESGATADQTDTEIKTAYENNADTNAFADAEKTKLTGIEAGATADQSASEIKTAYESNADTNAFTDAEQTKLSGIASGAEVNVQANWNETNSGSDAFIQNKPTIPAAYTDSDVDTHLNTSTASNGEVLSWTGTDYDWVVQSGGSGNTDLSYTASTRVIASSTGTDATLPLMSTGDAGLVPASGGGTTNFLRADGTFAAPAGGGAVDSVNTQTGAVVLDADDISDASTTNKYTNASDITKLAGIQAGAEVNVDTNLSYTDATRVLTSSTGTNTTLPLMSSATAGLVPASGGGTANFLRADGTFAAQGSGSFGTAVYKGPSTSSPGDANGLAYSTVNVATAVGTPSGFFSNNQGQITISTPGTYLASCTVVLTGSTGNYRWTGELEIQQFPTGGTLTALGSVRGGYIRVNSGSNDTYMTITRIITTTVTNEILQFQLKRISTTSGNAQYVVNNSTIQIARIDGVPGATGATGADGPSNIPQNSQTSAYTLAASDDGKHVNTTTGGVTVPSGVFSAGDVVSIFNDSTSDQTITQGSSVTLRLAGTATTGNRTLAQYGLCTVLCVGSNEFVISGAGLS